METNPIPFFFDVQSVLVSKCSQQVARTAASYRSGGGRTSHHTIFGDAEVASA